MAAGSNPGKDEVYEDFAYMGGLTHFVADYRAHDIRIGATQIYQLGRNAWYATDKAFFSTELNFG